ncbi:MAG TPA: hypothetical protein VIP98_08605 [Microlunatus sp.]
MHRSKKEVDHDVRDGIDPGPGRAAGRDVGSTPGRHRVSGRT